MVAWSGLRGAVSVAAALSLPLETDAGEALPGRDVIVFVTFVVVLVTAVGQGLTLPRLAERWAQPSAVERVRHEYEERKRRFAARAGKIEDAGYEDESQAHQRILQRVRRFAASLRLSGRCRCCHPGAVAVIPMPTPERRRSTPALTRTYGRARRDSNPQPSDP
jgi:hypothetical protein